MPDDNTTPPESEGQATPPGNAAMQDAIRKAVETQAHKMRTEHEADIQGLRAKNSELIETNKKLRDRVAPWEQLGEDAKPEDIRRLLDDLRNAQDGEKIKAGKWQEVVDQRVKSVLENTEKRRQQKEAELNQQIEDATKKATEYTDRYRQAVVQNAVAQKVTGLKDGALADVQYLVTPWLTVDDEGKIVATDAAPMNDDGNPVTIETLRDFLMKSREWLFHPSQGAGLHAGNGSGNAKGISRQHFETLGPAERRKFVQGGGHIHD